MSSVNVLGSTLKYKNLLVVIKQTAFEEYSQVSRHFQRSFRFVPLERCNVLSGYSNYCLNTAQTARTGSQGFAMETSRATLQSA